MRYTKNKITKQSVARTGEFTHCQCMGQSMVVVVSFFYKVQDRLVIGVKNQTFGG